MSIKKQVKKFKLRSEDKKYLARELTSFCNILNHHLYINYGGCCYVAYCIASLLEEDGINFKLKVFGDRTHSDINDFYYSECHYAIKLGRYTINPGKFTQTYYKVSLLIPSAEDILYHYNCYEWNDVYNVNNNDLIFFKIKEYYEECKRVLCERQTACLYS